eukprot:1161980-Pelagomonas_calceolata.AAC.2
MQVRRERAARGIKYEPLWFKQVDPNSLAHLLADLGSFLDARSLSACVGLLSPRSPRIRNTQELQMLASIKATICSSWVFLTRPAAAEARVLSPTFASCSGEVTHMLHLEVFLDASTTDPHDFYPTQHCTLYAAFHLNPDFSFSISAHRAFCAGPSQAACLAYAVPLIRCFSVLTNCSPMKRAQPGNSTRTTGGVLSSETGLCALICTL